MARTRRVTRASISHILPETSKSVSAAPPIKKLKLENGGSRPGRHKAPSQEPASDREEDDEDHEDDSIPKRPRKKGKGKSKDVEPDRSQFLERIDVPWKVGAHVSGAGGVENTVLNAATIGANAFAIFVKSQRKWSSPPLSEHSVSEFKRRMKEYGYDSNLVLPHGSYLINLANPDADKREKSFVCFLDDLKRCEMLGLELYNFHPGSTVGATSTENSLGLIAECINRAHKETKSVTVVLENMAGAGNIIGGDFAHLGGIIEKVEDKTRVGVCIDTCHAFAAGYDFRTKEGWQKTMTAFETQIGIKYLRGMHLNDSKTECGSKKDRHENIGLGHLTLQAFEHILRDPRTKGIPLVLETPSFDMPKEIWGLEIGVLGRIALAGRIEAKGEGAPAEEGGGELDLGVLVEEARDAVKHAEASSGKGNGSKKAKATRGKKVAKRKRKDVDDPDQDDDQDSACEHGPEDR